MAANTGATDVTFWGVTHAGSRSRALRSSVEREASRRNPLGLLRLRYAPHAPDTRSGRQLGSVSQARSAASCDRSRTGCTVAGLVRSLTVYR